MNEQTEYILTKDSSGNMLTGEKNYSLHLPPDMPASNFWSVIVYDTETGLMISTDQSWPSVHSNYKKLVVNADGSVDILFSPKIQDSEVYNWIRTIPGKRWKMILRLYDLSDALSDKTWKPCEIELIK
jgi:hypothetical protein